MPLTFQKLLIKFSSFFGLIWVLVAKSASNNHFYYILRILLNYDKKRKKMLLLGKIVGKISIVFSREGSLPKTTYRINYLLGN